MATTSWVGASGAWGTAANWSAGVPGASTDAVINLAITASLASGTYQALSLSMVNTSAFTLSGTGSLSLGNGSTVWTLTQSGGTLDFQQGGSLFGVFSQTGGTLQVDAGTLTLNNGNGSLGGTLAGFGTIALAGAYTYTTGASTVLSVRQLNINNPATFALGANLSYGNILVGYGGSTIQLNANTLTLSGVDYLQGLTTGSAGGKVLSTGTLYTDYGTLGGAAVLENQGTIRQFNSTFYLGDNAASTAVLQNDATGSYVISSDVSINASGSVSITNAGLFQKTGSTGNSIIYAPFSNTGTIQVDSGQLSFYGNSSYSGLIQGAGTLWMYGTATHTLNSGVAVNVANWGMGSSGSTTVSLGGNLAYNGNSFTENSGATLQLNGNQLTLGAGSAGIHSLINTSGTIVSTTSQLSPDYMTLGGSVVLQNKGNINQTNYFYLGDNASSTAQINNQGNWFINGDYYVYKNGTTSVTNSGLIEKTGGTGYNAFYPTITNTSSGTVQVDSGTMYFEGGATFSGGSMTGLGGIGFDGGQTYTVNSATNVGVANWILYASGTTLTIIGGPLTYGGNFTANGGTIINPNGRTLSLTGTAGLHGYISGTSGVVSVDGVASVDGLNVSGPITLRVTKSANEGGNVTLTYSGSGSPTISVTGATAYYNIINDSSVYISGSGSIINGNVFQKTGGTGTSYVDASFTNNKYLIANSGTLYMRGVSNSYAGTLGGAGQIVFGGGTGHTHALQSGLLLNTKFLTVADSGTTLQLAANQSYTWTFTQNGSTTLNLGGYTFTLTPHSAGNGVHGLISGGGLLLSEGRLSVDNMTLGNGTTMENTKTAFQATNNAYLGNGTSGTATFNNDAGAIYDISADASLYVNGATQFNNSGTLQKSGGVGNTYFDPQISSTGSIYIRSGVMYFRGGGTIGGSAYGGGTLQLGGSKAWTISAGTSVTAAYWNLVDSGSSLTLGGSLTYANTFYQSGSTTIAPNGQTLTLKKAGLHGNTSGTGTILGSGFLSLDGLTINGSVTVENASSAVVSGSMYVSSDGSSASQLKNDSGATLSITNDSDIYISGNGTITNAGTFQKTGGIGTSYVDPNLSNTGTISVVSGTLYFRGTDTYTGSIIGGGQFVFGGGHTHTLNSGFTAKVSYLTTADSGTTLSLGENFTYNQTFTENGYTTINVNTFTMTLNGTSFIYGGVTGTTGKLVNAGSMIDNSMTLYGTATLENKATITQSAQVYMGNGAGAAPILQNDAGASYVITTDVGMSVNGSPQVTNSGLFQKAGGVGTSYIDPTFVNTSTGTIQVDTGNLWFRGNDTYSGTIQGAGTFLFGGSGSHTLNAGTTISVSNLDVVDSANVILNAGITYAGNFTQNGYTTVTLNAQTLTLNGAAGLHGTVASSSTGIVNVNGGADATSMTLAGSATMNVNSAVYQNNTFYMGNAAGNSVKMNIAGGASYNFLTDTGIQNSGTNLITNNGLFEKTGGFGTSYVDSQFNNTSTGQVSAASGALYFRNNDIFGGTLAGAGTIVLGGGGAYNLGASVGLGSSNLTVTDSGTTVTFNGTSSYNGTFTQNGYTTLTLGANTFTLGGSAGLHGGFTATSGGKLVMNGTSDISSMTIGGAAKFENQGTATVNYTVYVGDNAGSTAVMQNDAAGTVNIVGDYGINANGTVSITNAGLFEKTGGFGTATIGPSMVNTGTINDYSGAMTFAGSLTNSSTINVSNNAALSISGSYSGTGSINLSNFGSLTVAAAAPSTQTINFNDATGLIKTSLPGSFASLIHNMVSGDRIDLTNTGVTGLSYNNTTKFLTVTNGASTVANLHIDGSHSTANFGFSGDGAGGTYVFLK
jgi:fibronectin-binding autotransporter adhesin